MLRIHWGVGKIRLGALFRNEERDVSGWYVEFFYFLCYPDLMGLYLDVIDGGSLWSPAVCRHTGA